MWPIENSDPFDPLTHDSLTHCLLCCRHNALTQLANIIDSMLIDLFLHYRPDFIVHRIQVRTVRLIYFHRNNVYQHSYINVSKGTASCESPYRSIFTNNSAGQTAVNNQCQARSVAVTAARWHAADTAVDATVSWRHRWSLTDSPSDCQYFHSTAENDQHPPPTSHSSLVCSACNNHKCLAISILV